jgi:hypothetical protein
MKDLHPQQKWDQDACGSDWEGQRMTGRFGEVNYKDGKETLRASSLDIPTDVS